MKNNTPLLIEDCNLSCAWAQIFLHIIDHPGKEISPLIVSLSGFKDDMPKEDENIYKSLDKCLIDNDKQPINTVANTIFPYSLWRRYKYNRKDFFESYIANLPRYKSLSPTLNRRGIYFERLISFGLDGRRVNQLEFILSEYKVGARRSKFQASILDPNVDHVRDPRLGFPCLQHLSFVPNNKTKTLTLNAFYATQQIFEKAYGNYLGLCRLGYFMSHEMGLSFERMNCFVGVAKLDTKKATKKSDAIIQLTSNVREALMMKRGMDDEGI